MNNNPVNLADPSGNMPVEGCGEEGKSRCVPSEQEKTDYAYFQQRNEESLCQAGNELHCSYAELHPEEVAGFTLASWVGSAAFYAYIAEGEAAATIDTLTWRAGVACLKSGLCRFLTGAVGGVTADAIRRNSTDWNFILKKFYWVEKDDQNIFNLLISYSEMVFQKRHREGLILGEDEDAKIFLFTQIRNGSLRKNLYKLLFTLPCACLNSR